MTPLPNQPGYRLYIFKQCLKDWPEMLIGGLAFSGFVYCLCFWALVLGEGL